MFLGYPFHTVIKQKVFLSENRIIGTGILLQLYPVPGSIATVQIENHIEVVITALTRSTLTLRWVVKAESLDFQSISEL